ncbi:HNH endonuclease [Microbacterium sp. VKM Ac-2923]|uniref:HNH endonuclease n=1 Tax=Microbacterium sp. VKM Ac-2923 TaxID=2929476 RepID=UPI001FB1D280|nr:HNH endonuclease [Microbacterium sp. VKM Ac-2923]MCJ1709274.1 HNH endonuclease [Microbacterium sp. VKM Ac-2923]
MPWFKIDDGFWSHPKVLELSDAAITLWVRAGSYCAGHLTDGALTRATLRLLSAVPDDATELVAVGLWDVTPTGWEFHDWADYQPTREQVLAQRAGDNRRQELSRNPELRDAIRRRDGSNCQYCGRAVNWSDRKSPTGGTYDHVDPAGPNSVDNLVVACRGCNSRKGKRTPDQAGMKMMRSRSDLVTNQAPSRPVPTRPDPPDLVGQSSRDGLTDESYEEIIGAMGIDPGRLKAHIKEKTGRVVSAQEAMSVASAILSRGKDVAKPQGYVLGAITRAPGEVREQLDQARPTSSPRREHECAEHPHYPLPCDKCAQIASEGALAA